MSRVRSSSPSGARPYIATPIALFSLEVEDRITRERRRVHKSEAAVFGYFLSLDRTKAGRRALWQCSDGLPYHRRKLETVAAATRYDPGTVCDALCQLAYSGILYRRRMVRHGARVRRRNGTVYRGSVRDISLTRLTPRGRALAGSSLYMPAAGAVRKLPRSVKPEKMDPGGRGWGALPCRSADELVAEWGGNVERELAEQTAAELRNWTGYRERRRRRSEQHRATPTALGDVLGAMGLGDPSGDSGAASRRRGPPH